MGENGLNEFASGGHLSNGVEMRLERLRKVSAYRRQSGLEAKTRDDVPNIPSLGLLNSGAYPLYADPKARVTERSTIQPVEPVVARGISMYDTRSEKEKFFESRIVWSTQNRSDSVLFSCHERIKELEDQDNGESMALSRNVFIGKGLRRNPVQMYSRNKNSDKACVPCKNDESDEHATNSTVKGQNENVNVAHESQIKLEACKKQLAQIMPTGTQQDSEQLLHVSRWMRHSGEALRYHREVGTSSLFL